ncbi:hypothetical protein QN399_00360 [Pseudomonas sp. 10C3]|uniref:hypothetical protein n=1 Tax=Pseudomonas sp. 10C3 TaxID=3118753 RepID=UPI002E818F33|nr:hypothetical protein [Pseudomonas sp. 10C3]MEE3504725.1 hypothetical protein [Pseudomonas sp. 10C3]
MTKYRTSFSQTACNVILGLLIFVLLAGPRSALAGQGNDVALAFVQQRHLGDSLAWLGYQVASRTVAFATLVQKVGKTQAQTTVQDALQHLQPRYQEQWNSNMATAYAESFTPDELRELNEGSPSSALANKFRARQKDVGMSMKAKSDELLETFVSKALLDAQDTVSH